MATTTRRPKPSKGAMAVADPNAVDVSTDDYLRAEAIVTAINENLPPGSRLKPIPKGYIIKKQDREVVSTALHTAFQLCGGVPALVKYASENPKDFYALWGKLIPSPTETAVGGTVINFQSPVPANALDRVTIDQTGRVCDIDDLEELR